MKIEELKKRLVLNRPTKSITLTLPVDVIKDLERVAPTRGASNARALARSYIGQGLRADLEKLDNDSVAALVRSLKKRGISRKILDEALAESREQP